MSNQNFTTWCKNSLKFRVFSGFQFLWQPWGNHTGSFWYTFLYDQQFTTLYIFEIYIYICIILQTNLLAGNFSPHQLAYDAIVQRVHVTVDPVQRLHPVRPIARLREQVTWQVLWRHIVGLEGRLRRGRLRVRFQWWAWWLNEYLISLIIYIYNK